MGHYASTCTNPPAEPGSVHYVTKEAIKNAAKAMADETPGKTHLLDDALTETLLARMTVLEKRVSRLESRKRYQREYMARKRAEEKDG